MAEPTRWHSEFERICIKILEGLKFGVSQQALFKDLRFPDYDILASYGEQKYIIEVRWSAYRSIDLERLRDWSAKTAARSGARIPILIVSGKVNQARKQWAEQEYKIQIWDRDLLLEQGRATGLYEELGNFFQASDKAGKATRSRKTISQDERELAEETRAIGRRAGRGGTGLLYLKALKPVKVVQQNMSGVVKR